MVYLLQEKSNLLMPFLRHEDFLNIKKSSKDPLNVYSPAESNFV